MHQIKLEPKKCIKSNYSRFGRSASNQIIIEEAHQIVQEVHEIEADEIEADEIEADEIEADY